MPGGIAAEIDTKLRRALEPESIDIVDESERHRGHSGWKEDGETHFRVTIVTKAFDGTSRLERHRMVNQVLSEELAGPVHALSIAALTPDEARRVNG